MYRKCKKYKKVLSTYYNMVSITMFLNNKKIIKISIDCFSVNY